MTRYTFILPAYKRRYLREALQSILGQTYSDFKVIVSDDASPEGLHEEIADLLKDERVAFRRNEQNIGGKSLVAHWNLLVDMVDTEYFVLASDDDIYHKDYLEEMDKLVAKYPCVDVLRARVERINGDGDIVLRDPAFEEYVDTLKFQYDSYMPFLTKCISNYMFRTEAMKENHGFFEYPLAWYADISTVMQMSANGAVNTRDVLFSYRMSDINISSDEATTPEAARKKMDATLQYDAWMTKHLATFASVDKPLAQHYLKEIWREHKLEIIVKMVNYSKGLSLGQLLRLVKTYRKKGYFDSSFRVYWVMKEWFKQHKA